MFSEKSGPTPLRLQWRIFFPAVLLLILTGCASHLETNVDSRVDVRIRLVAISPEAKRSLGFKWLQTEKTVRNSNYLAASAILSEDESKSIMRAFAKQKGVEFLDDSWISTAGGMPGRSRMRFAVTNATGVVLAKEFEFVATPTISAGKAIDLKMTATWSVSMDTNSWIAPGPVYIGDAPITTLSHAVPPTRVRQMTLGTTVPDGQSAVFAKISDGFPLRLAAKKQLNAAFSTDERNELILFVTPVKRRTSRH